MSALAARRNADLRAQEERVHVLHTDEPHSLYTNTANGYQAIPYTEMNPPVPPGLRSVRLQKTTAYATSEVANLWGGRSQGRARMRAAWGLDSPRTDRVRSFLDARGVPERGPYVVLWSRLSSRQEGEAHPQHDTGTEGMRQIIDGLPPGTTVIIAGDASRNGALARLADSHDNVHDLTEFWNDDDWREAFPDATREDQLQFFDHLAGVADGDLKHLGFRSGNLEAFALVGHQVRYLEETGNRQAKRMQTWHAPAIGYQRIALNQVPTLAGQWVVANAAVTGKETAVPWWSHPDGSDAEAKIRAQHKTAALAEFNIGYGREWRGFTPLDLTAIKSYLDFAAKGTPGGVGTPTVLGAPPAAGETSATGGTSAAGQAPVPAKKMTPEVTAAFYRGYAEYLFSDQGARDFDSVYYAFLDEQGILDQDLARHQKLLPQMAKFHDQLLAVEADQAASATVIPHTDREPMRLYRKMAEAEAEVFLNARDAKAGLADAMAYNRSDEYRKFFTTSLSHTSVFENANAASDSEAVVEFTLPGTVTGTSWGVRHAEPAGRRLPDPRLGTRPPGTTAHRCDGELHVQSARRRGQARPAPQRRYRPWQPEAVRHADHRYGCCRRTRSNRRRGTPARPRGRNASGSRTRTGPAANWTWRRQRAAAHGEPIRATTWRHWTR